MIRQEKHIVKGLQRDWSVSKFSPEFVFDAQNIRITARDGNTLLSVSNERGTKEVNTVTLSRSRIILNGIVIGYTVLNKYVTLFSCGTVDTIYRLEKSGDSFIVQELFSGNLGFDVHYPIEAIGIYENEYIQKVYWTDGKNQPRMINIVSNSITSDNTQFDFVQNLMLQEKASITRSTSTGGRFHSGVIQYAFTYYYRYGQESNIFYTSPLQYITFDSRGGSPEETVSNSFSIFIENADSRFDYVRIYSIHRTSIDAVPTVKNLADLPITYDTVNSYEKLNDQLYETASAFVENISMNDAVELYTDEKGKFPIIEVPYDREITSVGDYYTFHVPQDNVILLHHKHVSGVIMTYPYIAGPECTVKMLSGKYGSGSLQELRNVYDATSVLKHVAKSITYTDNGTTGSIIDPSLLLYIGGESIIAGTMTHKDNTLFLGNIKLNRNTLQDIKDSLLNLDVSFSTRISSILKNITGTYPYDNTLSEQYRRGFHSHEWYRFGVQFQHTSGKWSEPLFIKDSQNTQVPSIEYIDSKLYTRVPKAQVILPASIGRKALELGYTRVRGVVVYPSYTDRETVAQGILCPTVFNIQDRYKNMPFSQSSWYSRPYLQFDNSSTSKHYYEITLSVTGSVEGVKAGDLYNIPLGDLVTDKAAKVQTVTSSIMVLRYDGTAIIVSLPAGNITKISGDGPDTISYDSSVVVQKQDFGDIDGDESSGDSKAGVISNYNWSQDSVSMDFVNKGAWAEYRHLRPIPDNWNRNAEIQCLAHVPSLPVNGLTKDSQSSAITTWVANHQEYYYVDKSVVTLHSPEFEFDESLQNIDTSGLKLRIVGKIAITGTSTDIDIQTKTQNIVNKLPGIYKESIGTSTFDYHGLKGYVSNFNYIDGLDKPSSGLFYEDSFNCTGFLTYPWHRNGSLNMDGVPKDDGSVRTALLSHKKMSNLKFSAFTSYLDTPWYSYNPGNDNFNGISSIVVFNSDTSQMERLKSPQNSGIGDLNYYGNIDKTLFPSRVSDEYTVTYSGDNPDNGKTSIDIGNFSLGLIKNRATSNLDIKLNRINGYPICISSITSYSGDTEITQDFHQLFTGSTIAAPTIEVENGTISNEARKEFYGTDPVSIKYKSAPHAVIAFNYTKDKRQFILPSLNNINREEFSFGDYILPWDKECTGIYQDNIDYTDSSDIQKYNSNNYGFLWIGELYKDNVENRFGGTTTEALEDNLWLPAGEPVSINGNSNTIVDYIEGDTFFQRYDCLKTYPYTLEDQNSMTEIVSFLCESRINLDGRYDKNRGLASNLVTTRENFNFMNKVYSQSNNFFSYRGMDYSKYNTDYFPNTITWTKEKSPGEITDTWTNISMASTLDLDGDKGEVTSLNNYNNEIYCFQKQGLSNILFNSRVQIPASDGVPIEITNGLKVGGKRYISNTIGCNNKWSVVTSPAGIYFIDNLTNSIYIFNGQQITSLSDTHGFRQWIGENNSLEPWNPQDFNNFISYYDKNNDDVYFVNGNTSLVYSELLGQFTSFMSYERVPAMFNVESDFYSIKDNRLWHNFEGDYNMFYGQYKPHSITFVSNQDNSMDKVYNTIEFRADYWNDNTLLNLETFDTLEIWNEYQKGMVSLYLSQDKPSTIKKKFRVWRANIPRSNVDWNGNKANGRDRIRNTWAYIKLSKNSPNTNRLEFHDIDIHYTV